MVSLSNQKDDGPGKGEGKTPAAHGSASTNLDLMDVAALRRFPQ
jgi:hypothetical protein